MERQITTRFRSRQLKLFEAETRLQRVIHELEQHRNCGNRVMIEIPKIGHLLKPIGYGTKNRFSGGDPGIVQGGSVQTMEENKASHQGVQK